MSSHEISVIVYALIAGAGVVVELVALAHPERLASIGRTLRRAMRTRTGRIGVVTGWVWLGLHFFGL